MRVVRCPRCGHENRAAISVSICDRCGHDISTLPNALSQPAERDLRLNPDQVIVVEPIGAGPAPPVTRQTVAPVRPVAPQGSLAARVGLFIGRVILAVAALTVGLVAGVSRTAGSALEADQYIAGSVAIVAIAAAISGLVMMLVGGSPDRSQRITFGLRALGFLLTTVGTWTVTAIAHGPVGEAGTGQPVDAPPAEMMLQQMPGTMPGGPGHPGEGTGMPGAGGSAPPGMGPPGAPGRPPGAPMAGPEGPISPGGATAPGGGRQSPAPEPPAGPTSQRR